QLQIVFDVSPSGYLLVNTQHEILLVNNIIHIITGLSMLELLAMSEDDFWVYLSNHANEPLAPIENTDKLQRIDLIKPRRVSLLCGMREIYLPNGDLLGKLYFLHDITKEEESNRIKSDFLTNATHELRTPLATIHGYSELLNSGMIPADMQPDIIDMIYQQSTWLITMINELLDLSRIEERAGADFVIESYPLADLIQQSINEFVIPEGRAAIVYQPLENVINVKVDNNKFKQALLNIIDNAYKYSPNGGDVLINVQRSATQNTVEIEVRDSGLGLTEDEISHVFERFFRVDKSGNVAGVGLGLSLSKEIINLLNGDIYITSVPNQGSSVFISLSLD
ncbi:MAG: ATP-binding protein, partial [Methylococcaceae bacterium]